jgi:hypothetical protein
VVLARFLVVVKVDTARLARGQIDRGSTGSWPRLDWLVVNLTTARLARGQFDHGSACSWSNWPSNQIIPPKTGFSSVLIIKTGDVDVWALLAPP